MPEEKLNITQAEFSKCGVSPWGVIGLCLACFGYLAGPLQIAGHVATVTFSMKRCRWGATLLEKHGEADEGRCQSVSAVAWACVWSVHVHVSMKRAQRYINSL